MTESVHGPEVKQIDVGGHTHAYREAGGGSPLLLIHGMLASSRYWEPQLMGLADDFHVIAWDAPGAGGSDAPDEMAGVAGYAEQLAAFLGELGVVPTHLCGLSWGGVLALEFYRRYPRHVTSLILADTYAGWKGSLPRDEYVARRTATLESLTMPDTKPSSIAGVVHPSASRAVKNVLRQELRDASPAGYRAMARAMLDVDARDVLPMIKVPTLLIWGEKDERSPIGVAEAMQGRIARSQLVVIPDTGHVSSLERPEEFNRAIRSFLR